MTPRESLLGILSVLALAAIACVCWYELMGMAP